MKKNKIINGFCYLVNDTVVFISLYTETKNYYEAQLFSKFIKDYKINERHIILSYEENGNVTPLYKALHKGEIPLDDMNLDDLIPEVYNICANVIKGFFN